ncbi:MAG: DinB family protein [Phycisphaeraceae bacterium]|nr:DinB family protein [Phycisphaeraceae bacterium]
MRLFIESASKQIFTEGCEFLADIPTDLMFKSPPPFANHAAWQVGHIAVTLNFGLKALGQELVVDKSWASLYGNGSVPSNDPSGQPTVEQLIQTMNLAHMKLLNAFMGAYDAVLLADNAIERLRERYPRNGDFVAYLLAAHAGLHFGQIAMLRKLLASV